MNQDEVTRLLEPQFLSGAWAKSTGELLCAHHFAVWSICTKLADLCPTLRDDPHERRLLELAALLHDIGKMSAENQEKLKKGDDESRIIHKKALTRENLKRYLFETGMPNIASDNDLNRVAEIARTHHHVSLQDLKQIRFDRAQFLTSLLRTADAIASMDRISFDTMQDIKFLYQGAIDFSYIEFSRFESPTTMCILSHIISEYKKLGWRLLATPECGAVFVAPPNTPLPNKDAVLDGAYEKFVECYLRYVNPIPRTYTGDSLTLLSREHPRLLLSVHESSVMSALGDVDRRALTFFKLATDILVARGLGDARGQAPLFDLLCSANSTSAHSKAKETYEKITGKPAPAKVNAEMIDPLFQSSPLGELIPPQVQLPVSRDQIPARLTDRQLFQILETLANIPTQQKDSDPLREYLTLCVSMEEETNFAKLAAEAHDKYRSYKSTANAEKGVCERCGCPVSQKMQPALNLREKGQAFSQIKAKYQYRGICAFCGYDNLALRSGIKGKKARIFLRLLTKTPELISNYDALARLVATIVSGISTPRQIVRFEECQQLRDIPLPKRLEIPLSGDEETEPEQPTLVSDYGVLFKVGEPSSDFSPKDARAEYEPLYHIMKFLGFKVAIGAEEQEQLFGEEVETSVQSYYLSLAVVLFAHVLRTETGRKHNRYIFAREILLHSPSVMLITLERAITNRGKSYLNQVKHLLRSAKQSQITIAKWKGGEIRMDDLLKDAAFFADRNSGIPHFCVEPGDRLEFFKNMSRYNTGKPVSQALEAMMSGASFDEAMERFMRNIATMLSADEQPALKEFVSGARKILQKYYELCKSDVSAFIRAKNSLVSAIYIFTRYPDLKEVANG